MVGKPGSVCLTDDNVKEKTSVSLKLEFDSVQDTGRDDPSVSVSTYRVFINDQRRDFKAQDGKYQSILIDKLMPNTMYSVKVIAINNLGKEGNNCTSVSVTLKDSEGKDSEGMLYSHHLPY